MKSGRIVPAMASIVERPKRGGEITYQVRWREGGGRQSPVQTEKFGDRDQAEQFRDLVNAHGQHWPPGWIPGRGFAEPETAPDDMPLLDWTHRYVDKLTGIDERTRKDYRREVDRHLSLIVHTRLDGTVLPATVGNIVKDDLRDWVRAEETGQRDPLNPEKWLRRKASPKSILNRHGLLWCAMEAGKETALRADNPCDGSYLPRVDTSTDEEMVFLEREEYQRVRAEIRNEHARNLADWLVGTGMRWGEATAIQVKDINLTRATVNVQRAWKRTEEYAWVLGPPKTKKARRVLALAPAQVETVRRLVAGLASDDLVFRTVTGRVWRHANFYKEYWVPAVKSAVAGGLPRRPRIHDLRHTHVAWLIAANIPLPAIQARLGHESIQTTVDRYGHLVRSLDGEISAAVQAAMAAPGGEGLRLVASQ
jgi:integrase